jgi:trigger factor
MQIKLEQLSPTTVKLSITADQMFLDSAKQAVLAKLSQGIKVPGFRAGKAPANLLEKQLDQAALQSEFVEQAVNQLYVNAVNQHKLRPVAPPRISLSKFVPFNTLEFTAEVETVGDIKLADYKKLKLTPKPVEVTAKDVTDVLANLRQRAATKEDVTRAAKSDDEATIDFEGSDAKTGEPIAGADGKDYPLVLGSKTFIPGFEDELVGLKPGGKKTFTLTFPKDYGTKTLQSRKVSFDVKVTKLQQLIEPKLDDALAASIGPFKTLTELKTDIKKQLKAEKQQAANRAFEEELLRKIADTSTVPIPTSLVDEEINNMEEEEKRNIAYRGQTWQEHLDAEGLTAEAHREQKRERAELRVKSGLILGEIAEQEKITVTPEELQLRIQLLKGQYPDPAMQAELDKPENRRDITSRLMTEKTLDKLRSYASNKSS